MKSNYYTFFTYQGMESKQNFKSSKKQVNAQESTEESPLPTTSKSFRSKMFEKRAVKPIPKIADKQITLHTPMYQKYLESDLKLDNIGEVPQIWGCIIPRIRKADTVKKNYLKRDIDSPRNLLTSYIKRKSKLIYGIPILKKMSIPKQQPKSTTKNPEESEREIKIEEPQVSQFFTQIKEMAQTARQTTKFKETEPTTARQKVRRYSEEQHEEILSSKFFIPKPSTSAYTSRFGERLMGNQGYLKNQQMQRINNKSVYSMSLQQLRESINWKKRFLQCLNESLSDAKRRQYKRLS